MPEITMPRLSDTMEEGTLGLWLKNPGDTVQRGDILAEIETDKATMELEAYDSGVLEKILVNKGETVPIGQVIAVVGSGEGMSAEAPPGEAIAPTGAAVQPPPSGPPLAEAATSAGATSAPSPATPVQTPETVAPPSNGASVKASPMARAVAREHNLDLRQIKGTGPGSRIVRADVEGALASGETTAGAPAAAAAPPVPGAPEAPAAAAAFAGPEEEELPVTTVRKVAARRLVESMQQAPHFYLTRVIDADALVAFRATLNAQLAAEGVKLSVNDLIVKAVATALRAHPEINVSWAGDKIIRHRRIHLGVAVATDNGLIVPVVRDADTKSVSQISREAKELAGRARAGRLQLHEFQGGTFTITNLGMFGIDHFTAVINPPEAAILAVGATQPTPLARDGEVTVRQTLTVTLSIDHRALDGASGARFLQDLVAILQEPLRIVA